MILRFFGEPQEDKRLRQMILISAILHFLVIIWVLTSSSLSRALHPRAVAYTVELVSPERLGTNLPGGGKNASIGGEPASSPKAATLPPTASERSRPKVAVAVKEQPKPSLPSQQKETSNMLEKTVEHPSAKPETEKTKIVRKTPEPQQRKPNPEPQKIAKANESKPDVKTIAPKTESKKPKTKPRTEKTNVKKAEDKKSGPQKSLTKSEETAVAPEKTEAKLAKPVTKPEEAMASTKVEMKKTEEKSANAEEIDSEDRDQRIAAALARIKAQTQLQGSSSLSEEMKGTGPVTKGGEFGEGGGGVVRGIEFLIYTQQLQKRVQENWIVAEKKPGLVASVSFMIEPNGNVQEIELTQSSGDGAFDQSVVRAIRKAAPFPPPPQLYVQEFATQKIFMNFGGEGRVN